MILFSVLKRITFSSPSTTILHTYISEADTVHVGINHCCALEGAGAQSGPEELFPCTRADVSQGCVESPVVAQEIQPKQGPVDLSQVVVIRP